MRLAVALSVMATLAACDADEVNERVTLITNFGNAPEPVETQEPVQDPTPPQAANSNPIVPETVNEESFECVSIFRQQTCENGVLYQLDDQMAWILPGRTE